MGNEVIATKLKKMVAEGWTEARFGKLDNAKIFQRLLENRGMIARITQILGHATTVDTKPETVLSKHFLVYGEKTAAHRVLGKFV